jgi:hypothetical protein
MKATTNSVSWFVMFAREEVVGLAQEFGFGCQWIKVVHLQGCAHPIYYTKLRSLFSLMTDDSWALLAICILEGIEFSVRVDSTGYQVHQLEFL